MVHEKYIKRGGKVFGPYLYHNYRENGITKTRYLGKSKVRVNKNLFIILLLISLVFFVIGIIGLFGVSEERESLGELATESPFSFLKNLFVNTAPINVFVQIISNDPPEFFTRPDEILVCENKAVDEELFVKDKEEGMLDLLYNHLYTGQGIALFFNPNPVDSFPGGNWVSVNLYSGDLDWQDINRRRKLNESWAVYPERIIVRDNGKLIDSFDTNITIIEVNDAPAFNIPVQTILPNDLLYTVGDESNFYYDLGSYLESKGEETPKAQLIYNLTYQNGSISPFSISNFGIINITGDERYILGGNESRVYDLEVCVNDTDLRDLGRILHSNISLCWNLTHSVWGYSLNEDAKQWCDYFSLTITKENRPPIITSYWPLNLSLDVSGTDILYFNITAYDPDWTPVDVYWYVNNVSEKYFEGLYENNLSEFEYIFGCGVSGNHTIKAVVTDGLLNDSVQWNLSVKYIACPVLFPKAGGGGGGGGRVYCEEKWGCGEWNQCVNLKELVEEGWVSKETELLIKERCELFNYTGGVCGFQTRICTDFNYCKTEFNKPGVIRECYYTKHPNCTDGIKNCHDGACEVLVDCGGPCDPCPTCHDSIKNQGEEDIDCGGLCKPCVERPWVPTLFKSIITYSLIALLILVLFLIVKQIMKYTKFKKIFQGGIKTKVLKGKIEGRNAIVSLFFVFVVIVLLFFANFYIMSFAQAGKIPEPGDVGFLASYGLVNSFIRNLGVFFISLPFTSGNGDTKMILGDDSDGGFKKYVEQDFYFYVDYTYSDDSPVENGYCQISFEDYNGDYSAWVNMNHEGGSRYGFTRQFNYKGTYDFLVECSEDPLFPQDETLVSGNEEFIISNTAPNFILEAVTTNYIGFEDTILHHNFSNNFTDPDINDEWTFLINTINNEDPNNYPWIFLNGINNDILIINSTIDDEAVPFDISMRIFDTQTEGSSRIFTFIINPRNDPPVFLNLGNQTLDADDLFEYLINVGDEEDNSPFVFDISFVNCSALPCDLFDENDYDLDDGGADGIGKINISFTPTLSDVGWYIINFSVMDNSSLGNQTTSQLVNFTVIPAIWNATAVFDYLLMEEEERIINLSRLVIDECNFSYELVNSEFPSFNSSFNLTTGIINITPVDADVGYNEVSITASRQGISSSRTFNFTILNKNDSVDIQPLIPSRHITPPPFDGLNLNVYENMPISLELYVRDDDFAIPQKDFYDEKLTINLTIQGPNEDLFEFSESSVTTPDNIMGYLAEFTAGDGGEGKYNITINVSDANNFSSDVLEFNLIILNQNYTIPNITFPSENYEFNLKENVTSDLVFNVNHTVGDDLIYEFYIDDELRKRVLDGPGDNSDFVWSFTPNFTDETYGNKTNLTFVVINPWINNFNTSRTWNVTINHTNCPPILIKEITDKGPVSYPYEFGIDLMDHFYDADYYDIYYNNTPEGILSFEIYSNVSDTKISSRFTSDNWIYLTSLAAIVEELKINASDNESSCLSDNFTVIFVPPTIVKVPVPVPTSGASRTIPIALKIIMPGQISAYEGEEIEIPLQLVNSGRKSFNELTLGSIAFKDGDISGEVKTSLDKNYFKTLKPNQEENLTLTVFFDTDKLGDYEIMVNVSSKSPKYTDWGKIYINLQAINESMVKDLIVFTEEFIATNPQCIEISEVVNEAEKYFEQGDYVNAKIKTEQALGACKEAIYQVSIPKLRIKSFEISLYLVLSIAGAVLIGLVYYFWKRRRLQNHKIQRILGPENP